MLKKNWCFELWSWRRLLRVPWIARRSNQSILKEISPGCSLEGMMLKLKLQYFSHLMWRVDSLEKTDAGKDWGPEDEMVDWYHQPNEHEFGWTPGVDGQGDLACCSSWGCQKSDTTERLNWTEAYSSYHFLFFWCFWKTSFFILRFYPIKAMWTLWLCLYSC